MFCEEAGTDPLAAPMRVLLIDSNEGFRREALSLVETVPFVDSVTDVASMEQAGRTLVEDPPPDVVLLALTGSAGPGIPGIRAVGESPGHPRVVALTVFYEPEYVDGLRRAGAHGWVAKSEFAETLEPCLRQFLPAPDLRSPPADENGGFHEPEHPACRRPGPGPGPGPT